MDLSYPYNGLNNVIEFSASVLKPNLEKKRTVAIPDVDDFDDEVREHLLDYCVSLRYVCVMLVRKMKLHLMTMDGSSDIRIIERSKLAPYFAKFLDYLRSA